MPELKVMEDANISMWYHPESKILHHQTHRFFSGQPFRDALNKGVEIFQQYGAQKWLSDDRETPALAIEDLEWGDRDWFPRVAQLGWKYWAIVMPEKADKAFGQLALQRLAELYSARGVNTRIFTSPEDAKKWLEESL
jgi:hypothetical protein